MFAVQCRIFVIGVHVLADELFSYGTTLYL